METSVTVVVSKVGGGYIVDTSEGQFIETSLNNVMKQIKNVLVVSEIEDARLAYKRPE